MPTTKQRINISVSEETKQSLARLAHRDRVPEATKAAHLIEVALEIEEDSGWNRIAEKRDKKGARFISHEKTWKLK